MGLTLARCSYKLGSPKSVLQKSSCGGIRIIGLIMSIILFVTSTTIADGVYVMNMTATGAWCQ